MKKPLSKYPPQSTPQPSSYSIDVCSLISVDRVERACYYRWKNSRCTKCDHKDTNRNRDYSSWPSLSGKSQEIRYDACFVQSSTHSSTSHSSNTSIRRYDRNTNDRCPAHSQVRKQVQPGPSCSSEWKRLPKTGIY